MVSEVVMPKAARPTPKIPVSAGKPAAKPSAAQSGGAGKKIIVIGGGPGGYVAAMRTAHRTSAVPASVKVMDLESRTISSTPSECSGFLTAFVIAG